MTEDYLDLWKEDVSGTIGRFPLVFLQLGAAFSGCIKHIDKSGIETISLSDYLTEASDDRPMIWVRDVEDAALSQAASQLGALREKVLSDIGRGRRIVLQSRSPRIAYPDVPGSSLLEDAVFETGPKPDAWGSPADSPQFEATISGELPAHLVMRDALVELGSGVCASLDRAVFEEMCFETESFGSLQERELEALRGAGLIVPDPVAGYAWSLPGGVNALKDAIEDAIYAFPQEAALVAEVAERIRATERTIRKAVRARARVLWGSGWKSEVLDAGSADVVLSRARATSYPQAVGIGDLRDPLEWLTLAELLDVRSRPEIGGLGLADVVWHRIRADLVPVRERAFYLRPIQRVDADIAAKWAKIIEPRLLVTGENDISRPEQDPTQREILEGIKAELAENAAYSGEVGATFLLLVRETLRFLARTFDVALDYTSAFSERSAAPLEAELQRHFYWYLDATPFSGRTYMEVPNIGTGRADVVVHMDGGGRLVSEIKRELGDASRSALETSYLAQALEYQSSSVPLGQMIVLDLTEHPKGVEPIAESIWVAHRRSPAGKVVQSAVVVVVRGNRPRPSALSA